MLCGQENLDVYFLFPKESKTSLRNPCLLGVARVRLSFLALAPGSGTSSTEWSSNMVKTEGGGESMFGSSSLSKTEGGGGPGSPLERLTFAAAIIPFAVLAIKFSFSL
ncbi:hypothetical protein F2Q69_00019468 [Brassica cretica]|uniref:Uncharacterized protein n=1 Tax=Brassica cretica TaxID=69181 RepID=A0A8S9QGS2_BRACR|nr:hypothetical protein F2Q69_00019468 [Brassica cretica]